MKVITKKFVKELTSNVLIAAIIACAILFFIRPTIVKQTSMQDTLNPGDYLIMYQRAYSIKAPAYGDIIIFESNLKRSETKNKLLIKRVIGLPGDKIKVSANKVYRNGVELSEDYIRDGITPGEVDVQVPDNKCFVMGDNRVVSMDSRAEAIGCVDFDKIKGKAIIRLYPFNKITVL